MALKVEGVSFHFGAQPVLEDFSLVLEPGLTWLRGPNGAGKTTLMRLLGGALTPARGQIVLDGVQGDLAYRRACFYCGGDTPDLPWLTVREFLDLHLALYGGDALAVQAQLAAFHIAATLDQAVATLSLGQHKKLQLSLALALPLQVLLLDEPFNGLDTDAVAYLRGQLSARTQQCIVLSSHVEPQLPLRASIDLGAHL